MHLGLASLATILPLMLCGDNAMAESEIAAALPPLLNLCLGMRTGLGFAMSGKGGSAVILWESHVQIPSRKKQTFPLHVLLPIYPPIVY